MALERSGPVVGEAAGQHAVGVCLVGRDLGLDLERLNGVRAGRAPQGRPVEDNKRDRSGRELGRSPPCSPFILRQPV